ncbi:hypothetical protein ACZ81_20455 (plasmid) [Alteromonas macleodii]|jgi:hypothetical protein|nr:hypothetical protein ACZ81_20455 [Alteromonas macleodii]MAW03976.1 hypothetical protein [Alteromonas sp.]HAA96935.1 hypothetical protein [Alteromonas macleodii]HAM20109.1 hypothetical protein [Alteromonas macleodii]HAX27278.1 hypothetical protein [Alteromonas macleodii]
MTKNLLNSVFNLLIENFLKAFTGKLLRDKNSYQVHLNLLKILLPLNIHLNTTLKMDLIKIVG